MTATQFGSYLLLDRINTGGMAEIYVAKSFGAEGFGRILAIKRLLSRLAQDDQVVGMFIDEAHIVVMLSHPNIVQTYELGEVEGQYYIAMEYVPGKDLRQIQQTLVGSRQVMTVPMGAFITTRVCEALDYAHAKVGPDGRPMNLVHRDISPQNVLVSYNGAVKLADFGIAKATHRTSETKLGVLKGKMGYFSPEQVAGKPVDHRSDLFNVGVIFYEMVTGERPFEGESDFETLMNTFHVRFRPPLEHNPTLPSPVVEIISRSLAQEPDARYQSASELGDDLAQLLLEDGRLFQAKRLATFMERYFGNDLEEHNKRMEAYMSVQAPKPRAKQNGLEATLFGDNPAEDQAMEALSELYDSLGSHEASHEAVLTFCPVRVYVDSSQCIDATSTRVSAHQIEIVLTRLLDLGSSVEVWLQVPGLVSGLRARGSVSSVVPSGGQTVAQIDLEFDSEGEQNAFARQLEKLT